MLQKGMAHASRMRQCCTAAYFACSLAQQEVSLTTTVSTHTPLVPPCLFTLQLAGREDGCWAEHADSNKHRRVGGRPWAGDRHSAAAEGGDQAQASRQVQPPPVSVFSRRQHSDHRPGGLAACSGRPSTTAPGADHRQPATHATSWQWHPASLAASGQQQPAAPSGEEPPPAARGRCPAGPAASR